MTPIDIFTKIGGFKTSLLTVFTLFAGFGWQIFEKKLAIQQGEEYQPFKAKMKIQLSYKGLLKLFEQVESSKKEIAALNEKNELQDAEIRQLKAQMA